MSPQLGCFVLHALDERDERAVEQHLVGCDECLEEVGELAHAASLMALVRLEDVEAIDAPVARPRRARRPRWPAALAAAAAVLVTLAAAPAVHLLDGPGRAPQAVVLHGVGSAPRARAEVTMVAHDGGTGLHLTLSGAPRRGWCSLVARAADGRREVAATWPADGLGRVDVNGTTAIPAAQLSDLSVVTGTGRRIVSIPVPHPSS